MAIAPSLIRRARLLDDLVKLFAILPTERQEHIVKLVAVEADAQLRVLSRPRIVVDNTRAAIMGRRRTG